MGDSSHSEYHVNKSDDGGKNPKWKSIELFIGVILGLYRGYIGIMEKKMETTENENPNVIHAVPTIVLNARLKRMAIIREITRAICRVQNVPQ